MLSLADLSERVQADRYQLREDGSLLRFTTRATFEADGRVRVAVGEGRTDIVFETKAFGREGALSSVLSAPPHQGACVSEQRDVQGACLRQAEIERGRGVTEWWRHDARGLEQGWTLAHRPTGAGALRLEVGLVGAEAAAEAGGQGLVLKAGAHELRYSGLVAKDGVGRPLAAHMQGDGAAIVISIDDDGAVYPITVDPLVNDPAWVGDATGDRFGYTVAQAGDVDGDGLVDFLVGAYPLNRVYVYHGVEGGIASTPAATLTGTGSFGWSVAAAGDVNGDGYADVIVGNQSYGAGEARVYHGGPGGLVDTPVTTLTLSSPDALFGYAVSSAGDVNGDGYDDVIVGAPGYNSGVGRAYLYLGSADGVKSAVVGSLSGNSGKGVGASVAPAGDVNGDGYDDVIVGAPNSSDKGSVFVFHGSATGVGSSPAAWLRGSASFGQFGNSVASAGDVNGDGRPDVIVGAPGEGKAYVFLAGLYGVATNPSRALVPEISSYFGDQVSSAGDLNGDGYADVMVGDWGNRLVAVYYGSSTGVIEQKAYELQGAPNSGFGMAFAPAGDLNGDGFDDLLIGAPFESTDTGRVYVYLSDNFSVHLPTGEVCLFAGETREISWEAPAVASEATGINLYYATAGEDLWSHTIALGLPATTTSYAWSLPAVDTDSLRVLVQYTKEDTPRGVLFAESFESGAADWTFTGGWGLTSDAFAGTGGLSSDAEPDAFTGETAYATYEGAIDLKGTVDPVLTFYHSVDFTEPGYTQDVEVSTDDGQHWSSLASFTTAIGTRLVSIPLVAYGGSGGYTLRLRFKVDMQLALMMQGWRIDDLRVIDYGRVVTEGQAAGVFSISGTPLVKPVLESPGVDAWVDGTSAFVWSAPGQAEDVTYTLFVDDSPYATMQTDTTWTPVPELTEGPHRWRVEATGCGGRSLSSGADALFQVDRTPPDAFGLLSPADGVWTRADPVSLAWEQAIDRGAGGITYDVTLGTLSATGLTSPSTDLDVRALADGTYTWSVTAADALGHTRTSGAFTIGLDRTPPETAPVIYASASKVAFPVFHWQAAHDAHSGVASYQVIVDGKVEGEVAGDTLSYTATRAFAEGLVAWKVRAFDRVGNSVDSITVALYVDFTPPADAVFVSPAPGSWVAGVTPQITWNAISDAGSKLCRYELTLDSVSAGIVTTPAFTPSSPLAEGLHTFTVTAIDCAGNQSHASELHFGVDTHAPLPGALLIPVDQVCTDDPQPTFSWTACTDALSGVGGQSLQIDGTPAESLDGHATTTTLGQALSEGSHVWRVDCTDLAGHTSASESYTLTVDLADPSVQIDGADLDGTDIVLSGTAASGSTCAALFVDVSIDGGSWKAAAVDGVAGTWSLTISGLADGPHEALARASTTHHTGVSTQAFAFGVGDCWETPVTAALSGSACDDGDACTADDACDGAGVCVGGTPICAGDTDDTSSGGGEFPDTSTPTSTDSDTADSDTDLADSDTDSRADKPGCQGGCASTGQQLPAIFGIVALVAVRRRRWAA